MRKFRGFTLVEIMIVVAIIGVLIAIALPAFIGARNRSWTKACKENQTKVDGGCQEIYVEDGTGTTIDYDMLVGTTLYLQQTPTCPATQNTYDIPASDEDTVCPDAADFPDHVR